MVPFKMHDGIVRIFTDVKDVPIEEESYLWMLFIHLYEK